MKSLLTTCILLYAIASNAQESSDTFQIKDYKYRTPGFKALVFDFNFNGNIVKSGIVDSIKTTETYLNLSPASFNFFQTSSTDRRLHESIYSFSISGMTSKAKNQTQEVKNNRLNGSFAWQTRDQFFSKKNWFWEWGNNVRISGQKQTESIPSEYNFSMADIIEEPFLGFGKGRIENVNDAQMALFILNDLERQGLITSKGTNEQQYAFASVITDINNQRIFDNRRRRIYELQRIDSFIKQNGLSSSTDIRHFTTINDNWVFSFVPFRKHGNQWYIRVRPGIQYRREYGETTFSGTNSDRTLQYRSIYIGPEAGYESNKSKSLTWQRGFGLGMSYKLNFINNKVEERLSGTVVNFVKNEDQNSWTELNGYYSIGYFPNTRTLVTATLSGRLINADILFGGDAGTIFQSLLDFQTSYFLGYKTRLTAGLGISYNSQDFQFSPGKTYNMYGFNAGFHLGINHNIF